MAEYLSQPTEDIPAACAGTDRLENYLSALFELKYNISRIEKKYPFLGNELSSLCEEAISRVSVIPSADLLPDELIHGSLPMPVPDRSITIPEKDQPNAVFAGERLPAAAAALPQSAKAVASGPVAYSLDAAGGMLITALDKMGDGIIAAFEKVLWLGQKVRKQSL